MSKSTSSRVGTDVLNIRILGGVEHCHPQKLGVHQPSPKCVRSEDGLRYFFAGLINEGDGAG
jgi:hypothetical protein